MLKIKLGKKISNLKILQKKKTNNQNNKDEFYQETFLQRVELQNKKYNCKNYLKLQKKQNLIEWKLNLTKQN